VLGRLQQLGLTICFTDAVVGVECNATDCTDQTAAGSPECANPDRMFAKYVVTAASCIVKRSIKFIYHNQNVNTYFDVLN